MNVFLKDSDPVTRPPTNHSDSFGDLETLKKASIISLKRSTLKSNILDGEKEAGH